MEPLEGSTRIDSALNYANNYIIKTQPDSRKDILDVVVLVTDGESDPGNSKWLTCNTQFCVNAKICHGSESS